MKWKPVVGTLSVLAFAGLLWAMHHVRGIDVIRRIHGM
jgi:hypothetical protein